MNVADSLAGDIQVGDSVKVRFSDFSASDCPATVRHVSDKNEKNERTVVAECSTYVDGLLAKRVVNVDFVKKSVTGYKVKVDILAAPIQCSGVVHQAGRCDEVYSS